MLETLKSLPLTFYSAAFYRSLVTRWEGLGWSFILIATLISLAQVFFSGHEALSALQKEQKAFFAALPAITISQGEIKMEGEPQQTFILFKDEPDQSFQIVFDMENDLPDGVTLASKMSKEKILLWVNKKAVVLFDRSTNRLQINDTSSFKDQEFSHEKWVKISEMIDSFLVPGFMLVLGLALFVNRSLFSAFGGLFLWALFKIFHLNAGFQNGMRLASACQIPVVVLSLFVTPHPLFLVLIWFGFAVFGLFAAKKPSAEATG